MERLALSAISGETVISYERFSSDRRTFSRVIIFMSVQIAFPRRDKNFIRIFFFESVNDSGFRADDKFFSVEFLIYLLMPSVDDTVSANSVTTDLHSG